MRRYIYLFLFVACLVACHEDDELTPTERPEFGYSVPQGNHEYDNRIVDWNERCNVFILYKFDLKELYWQVTSWEESVENPADATEPYTRGLIGAVADTNYVGQQLDLLEEQFLNFYPDTMLRRCIPLKLLLCGELTNRDPKGVERALNVYSGYDYLAFNWGNETILSMTEEDVAGFRYNANYEFLMRLLDKGKINENADFYEGMNYEDKITKETMYERGFINQSTKQENDFEYYLQAILTTSYEELIADPGTPEDNTSYYTSFKGILNEKKDVNGFIRSKYESIVNTWKDDYGCDIQKIGDMNKTTE